MNTTIRTAPERNGPCLRPPPKKGGVKMENEGIEIKVERIYRLDTESSLKGFADISIAGSFIVRGLRIIAGKKGLFVGMPQEQGKDGKWYSRVYLINEAVKEKLFNLVLSAFEE